MSRALVKRDRGGYLQISKGTQQLILLIGIGVIIYFLVLKSKQAAAVPTEVYKNSETWEIEWSKDGLPTKVIIHREAVQK